MSPHTTHPGRRDGNDLTLTQKVSLADALCGVSFKVTTLDGRTLDVSPTGVISPNAIKVIRCGVPCIVH